MNSPAWISFIWPVWAFAAIVIVPFLVSKPALSLYISLGTGLVMVVGLHMAGYGSIERLSPALYIGMVFLISACSGYIANRRYQRSSSSKS